MKTETDKGKEAVVKNNSSDDTTFQFFFPEAGHYNIRDPIKDVELSVLKLNVREFPHIFN